MFNVVCNNALWPLCLWKCNRNTAGPCSCETSAGSKFLLQPNRRDGPIERDMLNVLETFSPVGLWNQTGLTHSCVLKSERLSSRCTLIIHMRLRRTHAQNKQSEIKSIGSNFSHVMFIRNGFTASIAVRCEFWPSRKRLTSAQLWAAVLWSVTSHRKRNDGNRRTPHAAGRLLNPQTRSGRERVCVEAETLRRLPCGKQFGVFSLRKFTVCWRDVKLAAVKFSVRLVCALYWFSVRSVCVKRGPLVVRTGQSIRPLTEGEEVFTLNLMFTIINTEINFYI